MGYRNEIDRLVSIYESTSRLEDYMAANEACEKAIEIGSYTNEDLLSYAYLQDIHSGYYVKKAIKLYNNVIERCKDKRDDTYYKAHGQLIALLSKINRSHESIDRYKKMVKEEPDNYQAYRLLCKAYCQADQYDDAWLAIEAAMKLEPDNAILLSETGYVCKALGRYDEAIDFFDKAFAKDSNNASALYGKACLYMDAGRNEEALKAWKDVVSWLEEHGYSEGTAWPKAEIKRLEKLIAQNKKH